MTAPVLVLTHTSFLDHDPGPGHPETAARLSAITDHLARSPIAGVTSRDADRRASTDELRAVHGDGHLAAMAELRGRTAEIDADTAVSPGSYEAAVRAAGASLEAVERVMSNEARSAFALVRPPGHHAEPARAMGFCLFNNVAIAAERARALGASRVLIVDWDVHHGNGTQKAFYDRRDVLYVSTHQSPLYPGTGLVEETGAGAGRGYTVNCPLPAGCGDAELGAVFQDIVLPIAHAYRPELVLVSAGFDAHAADPLAGMQVSTRGFAAMCSGLRDLAQACCGGRLVLVLEGGYALEPLAESTHACLEVLAGAGPERFALGVRPLVVPALRRIREVQGANWALP